jgi:hypothetical protein
MSAKPENEGARRGNRLLWWVTAAFAVQLAAWAAWFALAARHPVADVPLTPVESR